MRSTAIFAGRVVLGPSDQVIEQGAVLTQGSSIRAVGPASEIETLVDSDTARFDFPHGTLVPGLVNCHVHLSFDSSPTPFSSHAELDDAAMLAMMAEHARQLLASGVTTARDLGDRDGLAATLRGRIGRGECDGPTILTAGTPLTSPGGHCGFLGGEVAGDDDIANRVRRNKSAGADLIKVMASGGALTPGGPPMWAAQFNRDQLRHIVRTAAEHQLPVAAHAHGTDTIADCVLAGVRTIEHCSWRAERGFHYDHDLAAEIVARDIAVCRCVSGDWRRFLQQLGPNAEALIDTIMRMREAGVRFIAGTDAGVPGATFRDYAGMLEFFIELGFTAAEVLDMATVHPAHALDLGEVGGLRPGLRADIIVVDGDPLTDIRALHGPRLVMTRGRLFDSQPR